MKPSLRDRYLMHALAGCWANPEGLIHIERLVKSVNETIEAACQQWGHEWNFGSKPGHCERCGFEHGSDR